MWADCSSTMFLRSAMAATRAWVAMLLTARGKPRAVNNLAIAALITTYATWKIVDQSAAPRRHQRGHINRMSTPATP
jgi:hypothetical protein